MRAQISYDLEGCARCGLRHPGITFSPLRHPIVLGGTTVTHWASCPTTSEPILWLAVPVDTEKRG